MKLSAIVVTDYIGGLHTRVNLFFTHVQNPAQWTKMVLERVSLRTLNQHLTDSFLIVDHPLYLIFFRIITTCTERVCTQTCINMY